jgi:hypothetical protein
VANRVIPDEHHRQRDRLRAPVVASLAIGAIRITRPDIG